MGKDTDLLQAIRQEDVAMVMKIVAKFTKSKSKKGGPTKKIALNNQDTDGFSALHHAALSGNINVLHCLLESNLVIVDIKDNKGMRPLHYAAWQGKLEPVVLLLKAGASPNEVSLEGDTPLHQASQYGSYRVAEVLLQFYADPTVKNKAGKTSLDLAAEFGKLEVVNLLLRSPQSMDLISPKTHMNVSMHTPLHLAAKNGHSDVIKVLVEAGVDINMETHNGTALHEASLFGKSEVVRLLISYGINVRQKNSHGQTALDIVNKFTSTKAAQDVKQMLREVIGGFRARALQDYCKIHDRKCLSFKAGDIILILEQHPNGQWKGTKEADKQKTIGYFPANLVEIIDDLTMQGKKSITLPNRSASTKPHELSDYMQQTKQDSSPQQPLPPSNMAPMPIATVNYQQSYSGSPTYRHATEALQRKYQGGSQGSHEMLATSRNSPVPPVVSMANSRISPGTHSKDPLLASTHRQNALPQHFNQDVWPRRPIQNGNTSEEESGVDVNSSTESMEKKTNQVVGNHHEMVNSSPSSHRGINPKPSRSCENVLNENCIVPAPQRPHSDCPPLKKIENEIPSLDAKDADRIYEWLKRLRLPEYTNNFTKAGYDMPTIAKMTPEDLTAVGVTVPGHRKKMFAMIGQMKEPDVAPNFKPPDVQSWLRILDLQAYYNTLISNGYDQVEYLHDMTWEDLQEIGIIRLGHQKKFMLALRRLREIKKHEKHALDAASFEDLTMDTPTAQKLTSSPSFENVTITVRQKSAIQGSLESIGSDISNISGGSLGSKGSNDSYPRKLMLQRNPNMAANNQVVSSYVPCMTTVKSSPTKVFTGPPEKDIPEEHDAESVYQNVSFSTFKQSSGGSPKAVATPVPPRSSSMDSPDMVHRNSFGSSSTSSGASDQGSLKNLKENPYAIPKRGNSMHSISDKPLMTATIGRRKSLKQFKAALDNGTAIDALRSTQVPGYATIKRTPSRRTDPVRLHRHLSQERDDQNLHRPPSSGSLTSDIVIDQSDNASLDNSSLPDVTQSGEGDGNIRGSPVHTLNRTLSNGDLNIGDGSSIVPASFHSAKQQYHDHTNAKGSLPNYYQTLRRPPRKPQPLADDFRPRSRSFTDNDEHMQSPVRKSPPVSFRPSSSEGIDKNQLNREEQQHSFHTQKNVSAEEQKVPNNDSPFKKPFPPPPIALKPVQHQTQTIANNVECSDQSKQPSPPLNGSREQQSSQSKPPIAAMGINLKQKQINNAIKQQQQKLEKQQQQLQQQKEQQQQKIQQMHQQQQMQYQQQQEQQVQHQQQQHMLKQQDIQQQQQHIQQQQQIKHQQQMEQQQHMLKQQQIQNQQQQHIKQQQIQHQQQMQQQIQQQQKQIQQQMQHQQHVQHHHIQQKQQQIQQQHEQQKRQHQEFLQQRHQQQLQKDQQQQQQRAQQQHKESQQQSHQHLHQQHQQHRESQQQSHKHYLQQQHQQQMQHEQHLEKQHKDQQIHKQQQNVQSHPQYTQHQQMQQHQQNIEKQQQIQKHISDQVETNQTRKVPGFRVSSFGKNTNPPKKPTRNNSLRLELVTAPSTVPPKPTLVQVNHSPSDQYANRPKHLHNEHKSNPTDLHSQPLHLHKPNQQPMDSNILNYDKEKEQAHMNNVQPNIGANLHKPFVKQRTSPAQQYNEIRNISRSDDSTHRQNVEAVKKHGDKNKSKSSPKKTLKPDNKCNLSSDDEEGIHRPKTANLGANDTDTVLRLHSPKHRHYSDASSKKSFIPEVPKPPFVPAIASPAKTGDQDQTKLLVREPSVDLYSADFDQLDGMDDAVESDSSDNVDLLSGFENENTDTIKKQPTKQVIKDIPFEDSPGDIQSGHSVGADLEDLETLLLRGENSSQNVSISSLDFPPPPSDIIDYSDLNIPDDDLPLPPPPSHLLPPVPGAAGPEQDDVFDDIQSMFTNLAEDLASMMK
ncbi:uncharacterized protein [Antedon mediterranea]|uniref:uncharacterized protein n=1 Tax=Antedon mediterranea TaxID=105859 RepID=UPI003AF9A97B